MSLYGESSYFGTSGLAWSFSIRFLERKNMAFSYWESKQWLSDRDLLIVGGGIVGLSAALRAKTLRPDWEISVIERHPFSGGGSTRNAGFACFGSATELQEDRQALGDKAALELVRKRWEGLQLLRETLGDEAIGYQSCGSVELFLKGFDSSIQAPTDDELKDINRWLQPVTGEPSTFKRTPAEGFIEMNAPAIADCIASPLEGSIDTGKMLGSLIQKVRNAGITIINGCHVKGVRSNPNPQVCMAESDAEGTWFDAKNVLVATNAFAKQLAPNLDVTSAPNHVMVTEPIPGLGLQPTVHLDAGYVYARSIGERLLIGGGRHWGLQNESVIQKRLLQTLHRIWPIALDIPVSHHWVGWLGVGADRMPIHSILSPGIHAAVRLGGMGVAMGMQFGNEAADRILM
ncbi:MAG: NAD(P)/FAD-dependent oxidoreductase [Flavobacteriales bacterium]